MQGPTATNTCPASGAGRGALSRGCRVARACFGGPLSFGVLLLQSYMRRCVGVLIAALLRALPVHAGHPQMSEDTGTQGAGNFELELGNDWSRDDGSRSYLFQPQLSYGLSP